MSDTPVIQVLSWNLACHRARAVRESVFVEEQRIPKELEWDEWDAISEHALALTGGAVAVGTARLLPDGHLGRMAVLPDWRGKGVGRRLAQELLARARKRGMNRVSLHAQIHAADFYRKLGFLEFGDVFEEAGIPHIAMEFNLHESGSYA